MPLRRFVLVFDSKNRPPAITCVRSLGRRFFPGFRIVIVWSAILAILTQVGTVTAGRLPNLEELLNKKKTPQSAEKPKTDHDEEKAPRLTILGDVIESVTATAPPKVPAAELIDSIDDRANVPNEEDALEPAPEPVVPELPEPVVFLPEPAVQSFTVVEVTTTESVAVAPSLPVSAPSDEEIAQIAAWQHLQDLAATLVEPREFVLGSVEVKKLIVRARMELAAGEVEMAHAFAEAAAECEVPFELFKGRSEEVVSEIEHVRTKQLATQASYSEPALPEPASVDAAKFDDVSVDDIFATEDSDEAADSEADSTDDLKAEETGYRAIRTKSLSIAPRLVDADGESQQLPEGRARKAMSQVPKTHHEIGHSRNWGAMSYSWEAPALKYNPLYFEDPELERYGNEVCMLQPVVSGTKFFATIPTLPYQMAIEGNGVCHTVYDLGYDRPGNCVPYSLHTVPFSWTAALTQGGAATAMVFILP